MAGALAGLGLLEPGQIIVSRFAGTLPADFGTDSVRRRQIVGQGQSRSRCRHARRKL